MASDPFFSDDGGVRPSGLALWTRQHVALGDPPSNLGAALEYFDLDLAIAGDLSRASRLTIVDRRLRIEVRAGNQHQQRFSVAHELGHLLLATNAKVSFQRQAADLRFESYCNRYASHLLVPRPWLRTYADGGRLSLTFALEVARAAEVSLLTAIVALNEACQWSRIAVMWTRAGARSWAATTVVGARSCGIVQSADDTDRLLSTIGSSTTSLELPLTIGGQRQRVRVEAITLDGRCFSLFPASAVGCSH